MEDIMSKKSSLVGFAIRVLAIAPLVRSAASHFMEAIESDAQSAKKQIILLAVFIILFGVFLFSAWLCLMTLLFVYLSSLSLSLLVCSFILFVLNFLCLLIAALVLVNIKNNALFPQINELFYRIKK